MSGPAARSPIAMLPPVSWGLTLRPIVVLTGLGAAVIAGFGVVHEPRVVLLTGAVAGILLVLCAVLIARRLRQVAMAVVRYPGVPRAWRASVGRLAGMGRSVLISAWHRCRMVWSAVGRAAVMRPLIVVGPIAASVACGFAAAGDHRWLLVIGIVGVTALAALLAPRYVRQLRALARTTAPVAGAALAVVTGLALADGRWVVAACVAGAAAWGLLAWRWGPVRAGITVVSLGLPLYAVEWLASVGAGVGLLTVLVLALLLPHVLLGWRRYPDYLTHPLVLLILALGLVILVSLVAAPVGDDTYSLAKTYLGRAVLFPLLLFIGLMSLGRRQAFGTLDWIARAFIVVGAVGGVLSLIQVSTRHGYLSPDVVPSPALEQFVGSRAVGFSESPGTWGAFLVLPASFCMIRWVRCGGKWLTVALALIGIGIGLSGLRSAWGATLAAAVVAVALGRPPWRRVGIAAITAAVLVGGLFAIGSFRTFVSGRAGGQGPTIGQGRLSVDESAYARLLLIRAEAEFGVRAPLTGIGLGNLGHEIGVRRPAYIVETRRTVGVVPNVPIERHNTYLGLFAELGVPGLLVVLLLLASTFEALRRVRAVATDEERLTIDGLIAALVGTIIVAGFTEADRQPFLWWLVGVSVALHAVASMRRVSRLAQRSPLARSG
jgi:O-antigen ligase